MALPKGGYNAKDHEADLIKKWMESGMYKPEFDPNSNKVLSQEEMKNDKREAWSLICPPPNAYGRPHIGNISGYAYMDAMARYQRMKGKKVLVLPGKDHAGLEGEGVFVREVLEKKKINKFDLEREKFYEMMMEFFEQNMEQALKDEQDIGLSADFDKNTFTLDPDIVEIVLDTFIEMYKDGMIYKGVRLVNWDPKARSAVADNQVEYKDSVTPFFYFKYLIGEPVKEVLEIKQKYEGKNVAFKALRNKTKDKKNDLPFMHGETEEGLPVIGIGYTDEDIDNDVTGKAIGVHMSLDENYKIVIVNESFDEDLDSEIFEIFNFESKYYPGSHIIKFEEYSEDKYYRNGFVIGTVRPETIFADTAIACDPKDERYKDFVGKEIEVEFLGEKKKLNFISDYAVDKDFGTGLLKVTPAHSPEDWEIGQRHPKECLPAIQVIGYDLKLNDLAGKYSGIKAKNAREEMRPDMKEHGNLVFVDEKYENRIQIAERTKAPIEPLLSSQWYLKYDGIREAAIKMIKNVHGDDSNLDMSDKEIDQAIEIFNASSKLVGTNHGLSSQKDSDKLAITLHPESMTSKYNHWMNNLRDWAISRSLWWGYRLPVWYHGEVKEDIGSDGQVREMIKISGTDEWVELEYDNPNHLRVQKESPDKLSDSKIILIPGKHGYAYRDIYPEIEAKFDNTEIIPVKNIHNPEYKFYKEGFDDIEFTDKDIIVTHSLGARAFIKYCLENKIKVNKLIMLAPGIRMVPREDGKDSKYVELITETEDYENIRKYVGEIIIIHSDNDRHGTVEEFKKFGELVNADQVILEKGKGHYASEDSSSYSEKLFSILETHNSKLTTSEWNQDENVLDTWFSSGQWVYATLSKYDLMDTFFPSDVLVSAYDILENWDSRMMMFTYFKYRNIPFKNLFLTGLVKASDGQKMSKSKGNILYIDDLREKYGTDAIRMVFFYQNSAGGDYSMTHEKLDTFKKFANKIWNASRFVLMNLEDMDKADHSVYGVEESDLKIKEIKKLFKHVKVTKEHITKNIEEFEFGHATYNLYQGFWHEFADVYIEALKPFIYTFKDKETGEIISEAKPEEKREAQKVLLLALKEYLKMLHPFMPFISERIWQEIPKEEGDHESLLYTRW